MTETARGPAHLPTVRLKDLRDHSPNESKSTLGIYSGFSGKRSRLQVFEFFARDRAKPHAIARAKQRRWIAPNIKHP